MLQVITHMIISDELSGQRKVIENPTLVPRVDDQIFFGYKPCPTVIKVLWHYENGAILIETK